ncbi:acetylcholine receptor subunit alpha-like 1 [Folsomia candida]|nr:acetylcholine receptor subunit alpha-like 1 [Folsomia candida]
MRQFVLLLVVVAAVLGQETEKIDSSDSTISTDRDRLLENLFAKYNKRNYPDKSTVQFGLNLVTVDQDREKDLLNSDVWLKISWTDNRLTWDPADYGGLQNMRITPDQLWLPDTTLFNGPAMQCTPTNAILYPNGKVLWVPPCKLTSYCNFTKDATAEQECVVNFGSWTFDGLTMGLEFFEKENKADISYFQGQRYKVTKNEAIREEKFYPCCVEPYLNLKFTLGLAPTTKKGIAP